MIRLADFDEDWSASIAASLSSENTELQRRERQVVARQYDWNGLVKTIGLTFCERLGEDYTQWFRAACSVAHSAEADDLATAAVAQRQTSPLVQDPPEGSKNASSWAENHTRCA